MLNVWNVYIQLCFSIGVTVKGGVVLDYIILRGVSKFVSSLFTNMRGSVYLYAHAQEIHIENYA